MKYFAYIFIVFVIYTILSASLGWYNPFFEYVHKIPFGDKVMHVLLLGIFTLCTNFLLKFHTFKISNQTLLTGSVLILILATLEEISQYWIETRVFDLLDLTSNYIGILITTFFIYKYLKRSKSK
jgi:VanZ family protein